MRFHLTLLFFPVLASGQVRFEDIAKGPGDNWLTYAGDYAGHRHSPLTQINVANAANLVPKWTYSVEGARRLQATPIVYAGIMYVTNSNQVHALDTRSGRKIWIYRDDHASTQRVNRGAAILGDRVFFVTSDAYLVALNRKTGALLWTRQFADPTKGYFASLAPLALKDKVLVGVSGGDGGIRGYVSAYSAATGEEAWKFYTIPAKGEPGSETWGKIPIEWAGGATWLTGTYDVESNTVYWTTGNPWPDFYAGDRPGSNLYSNSVVALDGDSGKLKWHFQFTPHDTHDWDAQAWPVLLNLPYQGAARKLMVHANRNGFFYVLDRLNGQFLQAKPYVDKLDWATGIDAKGLPILAPGKDPTPSGNRACPGVRGASNWMSPAFNPQTKLLYVVTLEKCDTYFASTKNPEPNKGFAGTGGEQIVKEPGQFYLRAIDPTTGERKWEYPMTGPATMWAGAVSTAGGVIFFGDDDGQLVAVDAKTGRHLWHFGMSQTLSASPIVWAQDGKEYVTISALTHVWTFGLFEPAQSVPLMKEIR